MVMPANETCEESLLVSQSACIARSGKLRFLYSVYDLTPNDPHCWREGNLMAIIAIQSCIFFEAVSLKTSSSCVCSFETFAELFIKAQHRDDS